MSERSELRVAARRAPRSDARLGDAPSRASLRTRLHASAVLR